MEYLSRSTTFWNFLATLLIILVFIVRDGDSKEVNFRYDVNHEGFRLSGEVVKTVKAKTSVSCVARCACDPCCRSVNYKRHLSETEEGNCEFLHDSKHNTTGKLEENGTYDHFFLLEPRKEYRDSCVPNKKDTNDMCLSNPCHPNATCNSTIGSFSCTCNKGLSGDGYNCTELRKRIGSCKELFENDRSLPNGTYQLQLNETSEEFHAYCHMSELPQCGGGGWTLVLKIDGNMHTFKYSSPLWSDKITYQDSHGLDGLTEVESKSASFWNTPFTKMCLGMKVERVTNWVKINREASSLYDVIAGGNFQPTILGRTAWKSLVDGSSLQKNCNLEGFNIRKRGGSTSLRLGIVSNNQNDCNTPNSFVGFGFEGELCGGEEIISCGNVAQCRNNDNGHKRIAAFGFILVQ